MYSSNALKFAGRILTVMCNEMTDYIILGGLNVQQIDSIVKELKTIMQDNDISQNHLVNALDGKCARNTILKFLQGDADCKLSTLLMILDACGANLRIDTERSRESILSGDIASYRTEIEKLRSDLEHTEAERKYFQDRFDELVDKNTFLAQTIDKQQATIDRYMLRTEKHENALFDALENIKRKDARIVELMKEADRW